MLHTTCTVCSAPLSDGVVQCVDCATRYCGERCERMDRRRNGHGKVCGIIARGGGAEQYYADIKYEEAATEAVEACTEETAGKTCYICLEGDNLVRDALVALDDAVPRARRVLGPDHPLANALEESRRGLRSHIDRVARRGL